MSSDADVNMTHFKGKINEVAAESLKEWMWLGTDLNVGGEPIE